MVKEYNRREAVAYAQRWALAKNPNFGYFGGIGGDCTNYISQCILAGGGVMNYNYIKGWYFRSMTDRSPSWTSVSYLQSFLLRGDNGVGAFAQICELGEVEIGDIIQLRQNKTHFNHSLIVSDIIGGQIFVCAHSNDALNRPLNSYNALALMPLHIIGIKV